MAESLQDRIRRWFRPSTALGRPVDTEHPTGLATITAKVDDSSGGWASLTGRPQDYDPGKLQELYQDALTAWRKNPIAWRIIAITTDYVVGDRLRISSPYRNLDKFLAEFWNHPQNRLDLRLESMCDELARSGDLFPVLFRNELDGMSYVRFVTKDRIVKIETAPNDWENELEYHEQLENGVIRIWPSMSKAGSESAPAVMLHYSVNRPIGALLGESDLTTMLPWLQRYSRMLEDRVRLHWAVRSFLWLVQVPANKVREKQEQYRNPPEAGSIVVHDETEKWESVTPALRGADAAHDMASVRGMIDAGSGYPPHWRGEAADANLATATAMQAPTERHLLRRQQYFSFILQDLVYQAYQRAAQAGRTRRLPTGDYSKLFVMSVPDVSRSDNEALARSARDVSQALQNAAQQMPGQSPTLARLLLRQVFRFAGAPQDDATLDQILREAQSAAPSTSPAAGEEESPLDPPLLRGEELRCYPCVRTPLQHRSGLYTLEKGGSEEGGKDG